MKRMICFLSAVSMFFSGIAYADVDDVPEKSWSVENIAESYELTGNIKSIYMLLKHAGIITEEFGSVNIDEEVSRAEAATMFARFSGVEEKVSNPPFSDVRLIDEYCDGVAFAKSQGIIEGVNGRFYPFKTVTVDEAAEMAVKRLGYDKIYTGRNILEIADELKLLKGIKNSGLTRKDLWILLKNTLEADMVKITNLQGNGGFEYKKTNFSYMSERFGIDVYKGIVTAYGVSSLFSEDEVPEGKVEIDRSLYSGAENVDEELFGKSIYFYADEDGYIITAWENEKLNKTTEIDGEDVLSLTESTILFESDEGKTEKVRVDGSAVLIKNGIKKGAYIYYSDKLGDYDSLVAIDNDRDKLADVVMISQYDYYIVEGYSDYSKAVILRSSENKIELAEDKCDGFYITLNGEKTDALNLKKNDVLSVGAFEKSNGKTYLRIYVSRDITSGKINGIENEDGDTVYLIGEERHKLSWFYENYLMIDTEQLKPKMGDVADFYLSHDGKIVMSKMDDGSYKYAYLVKAIEDEETEEVFVKLYTMEGVMEKLNVAEKVRLFSEDKAKGEKVKNSILYDSVTKDGETKNQMIAYRLNAGNEISEFALEYDLTNQKPGTVDYPIVKNARVGGDDSAASRLYTSVISGWRIPWSSTVMEIPSDKAKISEEKYYKIYTTSNWGTEKYFTDSFLTVYNADRFYNSGFSVVEGKGGVELDRKLRSYMVKDVETVLDDENMPCREVTYYDENGNVKTVRVTDNTLVSTPLKGRFYGADKDLADLGCGDIIQMKVNMSEASVIRILFNAKDMGPLRSQSQTDNEVSGIEKNNPFRQLGVVYGVVMDKGNTELAVNVSDDGDEEYTHIVRLDSEEWYERKISYVLFDSKTGDVEYVTKDEITKGDKVFLRKHFHYAMEVYIIR